MKCAGGDGEGSTCDAPDWRGVNSKEETEGPGVGSWVETTVGIKRLLISGWTSLGKRGVVIFGGEGGGVSWKDTYLLWKGESKTVR